MGLLTDQSDENEMMDAATCRAQIQELVRDEYQMVYRFAYRLSGSHADAEDLTQQTFLLACRKLSQLRSQERVRPWLFTIVRNCFLKSQAKRKNWVLLGDEEGWLAQSAPAWPEEFDEEELQQALQSLPETFRTPVLLYYFEELSYKEISTILDVPIGTIMSRLARGKESLRLRLMERKEVTASSELQ